MDIDTKVVASGPYLFWLSGQRLLVRTAADGRDKITRFLPAPLTGRPIADIAAHSGLIWLIIDDTPSQEGQSIWTLPINTFEDTYRRFSTEHRR